MDSLAPNEDVMVTFAPGTTAPEASVTVPWIEPLLTNCAETVSGEKATNSAATTKISRDFVMF
jgi:hypothetical protein